MRTLLVDNHDSYTYNLLALLCEVNGSEPTVVRNDEVTWAQLAAFDPDNVVISPGPGRPGRPRDTGVSLDVLRHAAVPVLGVCLGHQALAHAAGGAVGHAPRPAHGRRSAIGHDGTGLFAGLPQGFAGVRYHSLAVVDVPPALRVTAWTADGVVMGLEHRSRPLHGVQFHPESIASEHGAALLRTFADLTPVRRRRRARRPAPPPTRRPAPRPTRRTWGELSATMAPNSPHVPGSVAVRHRALELGVDAEAAFVALFGTHDDAVWLDSAGLGRWSFLGAPDGPLGRVVRHDAAARHTTVDGPAGREEHRGELLPHLERELARLRCPAPPELPDGFAGGFAGYLGYGLKAECGAPAGPPSRLPDAALLLCDRVVAIDHERGRTHLLALHDGDAAAAGAWLDATAAALGSLPAPPPPGPASALPLRFRAHDDPGAYRDKVRACIREIVDGESYEVCLTTELHAEGAIDPVDAFRALRAASPAPHAALLRLGGLSVLSCSPERYLRVDRDGTVESRPMKGTIARSADPVEDAGRRAALAEGERFRAENLMICDLVRNDLTRVCDPASVRVPDLMVVESLARVHQLVSGVRGTLRHGLGAVDAIRASFPGGSMTGAPKLRTMEILDRLEDRPRGVYSGALGYLSVDGTADLAIVIRTAVAGPDGVTIGAGGAVLADSDPAAEHEEMLLKALPLVEALGGTLEGDPAAVAPLSAAAR